MLIFLAHFSSCPEGVSLWVAQRIALDKVLKGNLLGNENPRNLQTSVKKSNTSSSGQNLHRKRKQIILVSYLSHLYLEIHFHTHMCKSLL